MTIKGIICDFGGVLLLINDSGTRKKWADRLGMDVSGLLDALFNSEKANLAMTGSISESELWQHFKIQFGLTSKEIKLFREEVFVDDRLNTEFLEFLANLPETLKKAILSNAWSDARSIFIEKFHLDKVFNPIIISAEEGIAKPSDEIFLLTSQRMGLNPWECLFIDDLSVNAQSAAKVGMASIHFINTRSAIRQVTNLLLSQGIEGIEPVHPFSSW